jgi:hypothetical protein
MLNWNTGVNYQDLRFTILSNTEGAMPNGYVDSVGRPSAGIGFNLTVSNTINAVLRKSRR